MNAHSTLPIAAVVALCACSGAIDTTQGDGSVPAEVVLIGAAGDHLGSSVAAGDVNGDGVRDLVLGAPGDPFGAPGKVHVVFGPLKTAVLDLAAAKGFTIVGEHAGHFVGYEIAAAGDVNGDGLEDVLVAAEKACKVPPGCYEDCPTECTTGPFRSYLVYGTAQTSDVDLKEVAAGTLGFVIEGESPDDLTEQVFAQLGDLNGDGLADFAVSAPFSGSYQGRVYVVFGTASRDTIHLADLAMGKGGYIIDGDPDGSGSFGRSMAEAGDVNGDGLTDLVLGDTTANENRGAAYVVFGKATTEPITISQIYDGTRGFAIVAEDNATVPCCSSTGLEVAGGGDFNGDGLADVIVTAPYLSDDQGLPPGRVYAVFGKANGETVTLADVTKGLGGGTALNGINGTGHTLGRAMLDFDADGLSDYLVEDNGDVHVVRGTASTALTQLGDPAVSERVLPKAEGPFYLTNGSSLGDLDGDGDDDIALVNFEPVETAVGRVVVMHR